MNLDEQEQVVNEEVVETTEPQTTDVNESDKSTDEQAEATAEQAVQEAIPYDRFREVNEEKKYYQELVQQLATRQTDKGGETAKQVEEDPYSNMDAETAQFYRNLDKRTQSLIQKEAQKLSQPLQKQLENQALQVSKLLEQQFRQVNKDVPPNSAEEREIAKLVNLGLPLDKATWAVMGEKRVKKASNQKQQEKQVKKQQKAQANIETSGIQTHSPMPKSDKKGFRDLLDEQMRSAGL